MKFGKKLLENATSEWQPKFIDYKYLKKKVKQVKKKLENDGLPKDKELEDLNAYHITVQTSNRFFNNQVQKLLDKTPDESRDLIDAFEAEIDKINRFFRLKLDEYNTTHEKLVRQIESKKAREEKGITTSRDKINLLQKAFQEHYRSLVLLENYRSWNFLGCSKILKKFAKNSQATSVQEILIDMVRLEEFFADSTLDTLMYDTVTMFMDLIHGSRKRAMAMLRIPANVGTVGPYLNSTILRSGFILGTCIILSVLCLYMSVVLHLRIDYQDHDVVMFLFRILFFPVMLCLLISINVKIWMDSNINFVFIFEMDPRRHLTMWEFCELSLWCFLLWMGMVTLYLFLRITFGEELESAIAMPLSLVVAYLLFILFPSPIPYGPTRKFLLGTVFKSCAAPWLPVKFRDFWFVNQFTSLSDTMFDCEIVYCMYKPDEICNVSNRYWISLLKTFPICLRLMQSVRKYRDQRKIHQLGNAAKYIINICAILATFVFKQVLIFGDFDFEDTPKGVIVIWLGLLILNTMYKYVWDLRRDWGLLRIFTFNKFLLRNTLVYRVPWYYFAILLNLIVRCAWFVVFMLRYNDIASKVWDTQFVLFGFMCSELLRRFVWNIFRLESEHLYNADNFRVVSEIPLPFPMDVEANAAEDREVRRRMWNNIKDRFHRIMSIPILTRIFGSMDRDYESDVEDDNVVAIDQEEEKEQIKRENNKRKIRELYKDVQSLPIKKALGTRQNLLQAPMMSRRSISMPSGLNNVDFVE
ncbi:xenotropic and polytropic retrovirus receptor [Acrasis kona]|uniref:Xenotropic and polytropic retrovirus receptor n=1 Tax=Acrasis kona TaxID=1008807 RepID=A0AAW2ZPB3_9EUKA